jgi:Ca-activated chloride channel family protein
VSGLLGLHHFGFDSSRYLFALLVVPLLFLFAAIVRARRSRFAVAFTNLDLLAVATARRHTGWRRRVPVVVLALALATSAAALARPRVQLFASNRGSTIILLADVSGSMQATDVYPERIYAAIIAMRDLVAELPKNDKVGLITFSDKVEVLHAPTTDFAAIDSGLDVLSPEGGTALGVGVEAAVESAVSSLAAAGVHHTSGQYLPAAIVLESDGAQDRGTVTPLAAAELAKAAGVRIYGVALGTRQGYIAAGSGVLKEIYKVPPDPATVALLARESGGEAFSATSAGSLDTIYRNLGTSIGRHRQTTEISSWFELAAAILLVSGVGAARARGAALP